MKSILSLMVILCLSLNLFSQSGRQTFYEIKTYHYENSEQEGQIDAYLKNAFLPALHRNGVKNIGVFKPVGNDTLQDKRIYVLIPFKSAQQFADLPDQLAKDVKHTNDGNTYWEAAYNKPPYKRIESVFIKAFTDMPGMHVPVLKNELNKRVYELRSYEGPTEMMYGRKVEMFNKGGEIALFKRLEFNAVFYGSVISGSRMPNLMYMTTFEDMGSRDQHWKDFFSSPEWKKLSTEEHYKNTVSKSEVMLLHPVEYSEI